mgnify:CR=1 FL=1
MSYALVPDGFTLKKVSKAEENALKDHRKHKDVLALINNPEIIKQLIITLFAYLAVKEGQQVIDDLKEAGANISDASIDAFRKKRDVGAPVSVSIEDIWQEGLSRLGFGDD